jgi:hypothetical protein
MNCANTLLAMAGPLPQWLNFLAMAGGILLVAVACLLWFTLFRKKRPHHKRRQRKHREPRKLNPTLAESGGLPPIRGQKEIEKTSPP